MLPTTEVPRHIPPADGTEVAHNDAIDSMIDLGTKTLKNMEEAWQTSVDTTSDTLASGGDLRTTMVNIRTYVQFPPQKRSRL